MEGTKVEDGAVTKISELKDKVTTAGKVAKKSAPVGTQAEKEDGTTGILAATKQETSPSAKKQETIPSAKQEANPGTKTMGTTDQNECRKNVSDVVIFGDDLFKLLSKASSEKEGWMKSTKAYFTGKGCLVQVTTQQRNPDGSYAVAEALSFVSGVKIKETKNSSGEVISRELMGVR